MFQGIDKAAPDSSMMRLAGMLPVASVSSVCVQKGLGLRLV